MKYTFNKENWTGEEITIEVIDNTFKYYDHRVRVVIEDEINPVYLECGFIKNLKAYIDGEETEIVGGCLTNEGEWFVSSDYMHSSNKNPFIAITKILCNIL